MIAWRMRAGRGTQRSFKAMDDDSRSNYSLAFTLDARVDLDKFDEDGRGETVRAALRALRLPETMSRLDSHEIGCRGALRGLMMDGGIWIEYLVVRGLMVPVGGVGWPSDSGLLAITSVRPADERETAAAPAPGPLDRAGHVRNAVVRLQDLGSLYWSDYEATDSNAARDRAQGITDLANDLLSLTGVEGE